MNCSILLLDLTLFDYFYNGRFKLKKKGEKLKNIGYYNKTTNARFDERSFLKV
jgi:hypothetical protein